MVYRSPVPRTQLVEIAVTTAATGSLAKIKLPNQEQLMSVSGKRVFIKGIEAYSSDFMTASPVTSANPVASPADIINATLTLSAENDVIFDQLPLASLMRVRGNLATTAFSNELFVVDDVYNIDWTKCFIQLINAPAGVVPFSYILVFIYGYEPSPFNPRYNELMKK